MTKNPVHEGSKDGHKAVQEVREEEGGGGLGLIGTCAHQLSLHRNFTSFCKALALWCDVNVFRKMDKVLPLSCIIWITVSRHEVQGFQDFRVNRDVQNVAVRLTLGLCSQRKNLFNPNLKICHIFRIYLKSLTIQWTSSSTELSVQIRFHRVKTKHVSAWTHTTWHKMFQLIEVTEAFTVSNICDTWNIVNGAGAVGILGVAPVGCKTPHHFTTHWFGNTLRPGSFMALYNSNLMVDVISQYEPLPQRLPTAFSLLESSIGRWLHEEKRNILHIKWCVCLLCEKPIHEHHSAQTF